MREWQCWVVGDQIGRRGTITGGYIDVKKSRLELQQTKEQLEQQRGEFEVQSSDWQLTSFVRMHNAIAEESQ
jgi:hypothetical protein